MLRKSQESAGIERHKIKELDREEDIMQSIFIKEVQSQSQFYSLHMQRPPPAPFSQTSIFVMYNHSTVFNFASSSSPTPVPIVPSNKTPSLNISTRLTT